MNVEIDRILPTEAIEEIHRPDSQLVDLVLTGYNLSAEQRNDPIAAASYDYEFPNERAAIFLAKYEGKIVGSVTLIFWPNVGDDKRGGPFWSRLSELDPEKYKRACEINPLVCDVGGVVVRPELRGKNIGRMLLNEAVKQINPSIIVGNTKTVEL